MKILFFFSLAYTICPILLFAGDTFDKQVGWICDDESCGSEDNYGDESKGCKACKRRQQEIDEQNNEYYREVLDAKDPEGVPYSPAEAKEFEDSLQR